MTDQEFKIKSYQEVVRIQCAEIRELNKKLVKANDEIDKLKEELGRKASSKRVEDTRRKVQHWSTDRFRR